MTTEEMAFLKVEEKQQLLDRYFDIMWIDDASDLRCVHCHRVAIQPYVSSCQHIFCKTCRKFYNDGEQLLNCPQCQQTIKQPNGIDFDVEVKIHQLKIFCPNMKYGCTYEDQLRKIPSHLLTCTDTQEATLQIASQVKVTSVNAVVGELRECIRDVNNKVEEKLNQLEKNTHEDLQSMKSLLETINQRVEKNESLLQQTSANVEEMRIKVAPNTKEMELLQTKKPEELNPQRVRPYEFRLEVSVKTIQSDTLILESKALVFAGHRCDFRVKIAKEEGDIRISLQFKDGEIINKFSKINGIEKVKYIISDQSNAYNKKDVSSELELSFDDCFGNYEWIMVWVLPNAILAPPFTKDDCININMLIEPPSIDRRFVSNNGILLWRVDNFETKKEEYLYDDVYSPTFYTSPQGYRVRIQLLLNHSSSMAVEVNFLTGEHDATLTRHFPHMTTVTLINQNDPSKNLVKCKQREHVKFYKIRFDISKFVIKKGLKNDSLLLKVVIEPLAI